MCVCVSVCDYTTDTSISVKACARSHRLQIARRSLPAVGQKLIMQLRSSRVARRVLNDVYVEHANTRVRCWWAAGGQPHSPRNDSMRIAFADVDSASRESIQFAMLPPTLDIDSVTNYDRPNIIILNSTDEAAKAFLRVQ